MTESRPFVVIGGGPAGMAAAIEAARFGLPCTLIDEARSLGGQIYRRPIDPLTPADPSALGDDFARGERLRTEFTAAANRIEVLLNTFVLDVSDGHDVMWASERCFGNYPCRTTRHCNRRLRSSTGGLAAVSPQHHSNGELT